MGAGVTGFAGQGVQHHGYVEGDCHELVAEEEPGEAVYPPAYEGRILQTASIIQLSADGRQSAVLPAWLTELDLISKTHTCASSKFGLVRRMHMH